MRSSPISASELEAVAADLGITAPRVAELQHAPAVATAPGRVVFVNRYFHPDHSATSMLLGDLAFALAKSGNFRVTVVASRQRYDEPGPSLPASERVIGVDIQRVGGTRFGRAHLGGRMLDYLSFHLAASWRVWRTVRSGDVVVIKTDPPLLSLTVGIAAALRGARRINWLQDLFPEVASELGVRALPKPVLRMLQYARDRSLRTAQVNVVLSAGMATRLRNLEVSPDRIQVISNWIDAAWIKPIPHGLNGKRSKWGLHSAFVVQYSGNLGRAHEIATILGAIEQFADTALSVRFLFVGGGAQRRLLEHAVQSRGLTNVQFQPYQPRNELAETLSVADVHLVSLLPKLEGLVVPSKLYGICAVGRPTIFIGNVEGELAQTVRDAGIGVTVSEGDTAGLVAALKMLESSPALVSQMGHNARAAAETRWDKAAAVKAFTCILRPS
jgi:colanic acid biosynthesis glycosyl transferase WcaI